MTRSDNQRRLSAILVADVVGYSRMMGTDEMGTLDRLNQVFKTCVQPNISRHHGRIVKLMGDGLLAEYASAVEAVESAVAIQEAMTDLGEGAGREQERTVQLRIGINLGDIIARGKDIFGDGVNVAARLEALANPGCICISEAVKSAVGNRLSVTYEYTGQQSVKNIADPVNVYEISLGKSPPDTPRPAAPSDIPSIAVLPFTNLSSDPEQEYFSDGIAEEIMNALSHFRTIPVIARNSSFAFKGQQARIQQIASELGARYVLEGSVRKSGNRVRITAQLVDAGTEQHLWAGKFENDLDDIFQVQDEITREIVVVLQPELARAELLKSQKKRQENLSAWDLLLRGNAALAKQTDADHEIAREYLRRAIELDPEYSEAWAALAWSYLAHMLIVDLEERQALLVEGKKAAMEAVRLDGDSCYAHYVLGVAYIWSEEFEKGLAEGELALKLNPYHAQSLMGMGNRLDLAGRSEEGIEHLKKGLQLSPRDPFCATMIGSLTRAYLGQNKPLEALNWAEKAVSIQPTNPDLHYRLGICLAAVDRVDEARRAFAECDRLKPGFLAMRKEWKPYRDDERNQRFFAGMVRHGLL